MSWKVHPTEINTNRILLKNGDQNENHMYFFQDLLCKTQSLWCSILYPWRQALWWRQMKSWKESKIHGKQGWTKAPMMLTTYNFKNYYNLNQQYFQLQNVYSASPSLHLFLEDIFNSNLRRQVLLKESHSKVKWLRGKTDDGFEP